MPNAARPKSGRPKGTAVRYKEIAESLAKKIKSGSWAEGRLLPSHSQLAEMFDTGKLTIRRALDRLAGEQRVKKNAQGKWVVQAREQSLSVQSNRVLLIASHQLHFYWDSYYLYLIRKGIERTLSLRYARQIQIYSRHQYNARVNKIMAPGVRDAEFHGVLLHGTFSQKCLREYSALKIPVVLVDAPPGSVRLASVCVGNEAAARDAVRRMAQLGHRRIAFCRQVQPGIAEIDADSLERQAGFLAGLKDFGIASGKASIFNFLLTASSPNTAALRAILEARPRFTAVLTASVQLARQVVRAARAAGLILPKDLSVACFDSVGSHSSFSGPRTDFERVGIEAVELLESRQMRQVRVPCIWHDGSTLVEHR
jgi:LacI family transcriptional regulator